VTCQTSRINHVKAKLSGFKVKISCKGQKASNLGLKKCIKIYQWKEGCEIFGGQLLTLHEILFSNYDDSLMSNKQKRKRENMNSLSENSSTEYDPSDSKRHSTLLINDL
jgi:hypothetical protein